MIDAAEDFDGTWPFEPHFYEGQGFRHHYVDEGPQDTGETFVLLHGEPTWGYLYRAFIPRLARLGRVIVPDHMGFGKSETPQDKTYSAREHGENLASLLLELDVNDVTLVGQDWGGPLGGQFAYRYPDRVKRIVLIDSFVKAMMEPEQAPHQPADATPWMAFIQSDHFEPVMSHLGETILSVLYKVGLRRTERIDPTWLRAYSAPFPDAAACKGALQFPRNLLRPETWSYFHEGEGLPGAMEAVASKPALLVMGEEDETVPFFGATFMFRAIWPTAPIVGLPGASHYVPEDAPEATLALIEQFVQAHP